MERLRAVVSWITTGVIAVGMAFAVVLTSHGATVPTSKITVESDPTNTVAMSHGPHARHHLVSTTTTSAPISHPTAPTMANPPAPTPPVHSVTTSAAPTTTTSSVTTSTTTVPVTSTTFPSVDGNGDNGVPGVDN